MLSAGLVIVSYGSAAFLPACLSTLFENLAEYPAAQVALVENHPGQAERRATEQAVTPYLSRGLQYLIAPKNLGYGGGANWGWQHLGQPEVNIVLNPDMSFPPGWLARFIAPFEKDAQIGIVGCKLLAGDGTIQHAGGLLRRGVALAQHFGYGEPDDGRWDEACEVEFVTGAALGIRGVALEQLGGFDPAYFPGYYEDVDLCWRARKAGWRVWYEAGAVANHFEGATFGRNTGYYRALHRNRLRFVLQNLSASTILNEFVPAERLRLLGTLADLDRQASAAVYRAAALSLAAPMAKNDKSLKPKKEKMNTNSNETFSRYNPAFEEINEQELALAERVSEEAQEVKKRWLVEEVPFKSRLPFVAALRERFNSISTRWYVKPILAQQVDFNAAVSRSIEDLSKLALGSGSATDMQTATLASRMLALEERLDRIEKLLERLAPPEQH
jgi:GT2 family glycosyltransferase